MSSTLTNTTVLCNTTALLYHLRHPQESSSNLPKGNLVLYTFFFSSFTTYLLLFLYCISSALPLLHTVLSATACLFSFRLLPVVSFVPQVAIQLFDYDLGLTDDYAGNLFLNLQDLKVRPSSPRACPVRC